ncbi:MAG: radical SAM protein [Myxococcales bacterium]|nr:radical SAM protein [Myxococcales bacterium]
MAAGEADHYTKGLLRLTMACNERCPFCNVPVEDYAEPTPSDEAVAAELEAFLASGEETLTISGGEPTLQKRRLLAAITEARGRGVPFVELQTNAILIDDRYARALADAGLTSAFVSLLSDDPALHDELAGLAGAFPLCLRGIDALLDAGVAVTLNPVVAHQTQDRLATFVEFVHHRLPRVRAISLSAVQPHGRAAKQLDLLPDYAVLGPEVRRAHARAEALGLLLLNPYCGLPLCVGWSDRRLASVESLEAERAWAGGAEAPPGIDNRGNKRHGAPCRRCALRTRCGGAWHAYWDHRAGRGLAPPLTTRAPWWPDAATQPGQAVEVGRANQLHEPLQRLARQSAPTLWLFVDGLAEGDAAQILASPCTDVAILIDGPIPHTLARELAHLRDGGRAQDDQLRRCVTLGTRSLGSFTEGHALVEQAAALGVRALELLLVATPRHARFVAAMAERHPTIELRLGDAAVGG